MSELIDIQDYFSDIMKAFRVREIILNESSSDISSIDYHYRNQLFQNYDYRKYLKKMTVQVLEPGQPVEYCDEFGFYYICFVEPDSAPVSYHICGPYLYELPYRENDYDSFTEFARRRNIPEPLYHQVLTFFARIPLIKDMLSWKHLVTRVIKRYLDQDFTLRTVTCQEDYLTEPEERVYASDSTLDYIALEARYAVEHKLLHAIRKGDVNEALRCQHEFMAFTLEDRSPDPLTNAKGYIFSVNTLFRKAVEEAEVHPLYIDHLNGRFQIEISKAESMTQLQQINTLMIRKYCMLVQTYSRARYSELIRNCLNYIDFHYQEKITLLFFAEKYTVSKNYLSTLFHSEVGTTLTDYINATRIRQAIRLLNTTSFSMQAIAEACGFSDANYFTRTFRKLEGMSPLKYRQSLLNPEET